jgi:hypothetical protein
MRTMERDETQEPGEQPLEPGPEGEDHREGPPGYDLDEQEAIEELERERQGDG